MDLNFFLCQRRGLSQRWFWVSLKFQCYLAMVPNPDKLRVATDPQTLVVDIMAMWYDSHLLCEFLIFATLVFHNFPPLVFGLETMLFLYLHMLMTDVTVMSPEPLLCHVPKIATLKQLWLNHLCSCYTHGQHLCYFFEGPGTSTSYLK